MQYMLLIHARDTDRQALSQDDIGRMVAAYTAYTEALGKAGALVAGNRLRPASDATTVRIVDGKTQVLDGPYGETKEQLGGYYVIEAPDLDGAIAWAARCPGASFGTIEVRPIWAM